VAAIASAMRTLAADEALRQRMGDAAATLMREHTWDRVAARTLEVYHEHLARRHKPEATEFRLKPETTGSHSK
jgi:glycosyltransferase involved in cell wall biosynthesis